MEGHLSLPCVIHGERNVKSEGIKQRQYTGEVKIERVVVERGEGGEVNDTDEQIGWDG